MMSMTVATASISSTQGEECRTISTTTGQSVEDKSAAGLWSYVVAAMNILAMHASWRAILSRRYCNEFIGLSVRHRGFGYGSA
jgi:hypothetical protein